MPATSHFNCFPSDFLNGIIGLNPDEIAVYTVVMMLQYDRGRPVAYVGREREIGTRAGRMPVGRLRTAVDHLIEIGKLELTDGALNNRRAADELVKIGEKISKNRENSTLGGKATREKWKGKPNNNNGGGGPSGLPIGVATPGPIQSPESRVHPHQPAAAEDRVREPPPQPSRKLEDECRELVGTEPCLLSLDFHVLERLLTQGVTREDVLEGIRVGLSKADANYRFRTWRAFENWIRNAAKDRMAAGARTTAAQIIPFNRQAAGTSSDDGLTRMWRAGAKYFQTDDDAEGQEIA